MMKVERAGIRPLVLISIALCFLGACAEHEAQVLFIESNQMIDDKSNCELQVGGAGIIRPYGYIDLSLTNKYILFPSFSSGMPKTEEVTGKSSTELASDNSTIQILGAIVDFDVDPLIGAEILARTGASIPQGLFVHTTASVEANSESLTAVEVVPPFVGELFRQAQLLMGVPYQSTQVLVRVTLEGQLLDGTTVYSNEFVYPLTFCNQCLIFFPVEDCTIQESATDLEAPCFPGQDDAVDCRLCYILASNADEAQKCLAPPQ